MVDDGSSDNGPEIASSYGPGVRVIAIPHRGHPAARNAGVAASTGDFLAFLDADDLWTANKISYNSRLSRRTRLWTWSLATCRTLLAWT